MEPEEIPTRSVTISNVAPDNCHDFYFEVESITRDTDAYDNRARVSH